MQIETLYSKTGSSGNCTVFDDGNMMFGFDCGIPQKEVNSGIFYKISKLKHIFVTHAHVDHGKYCGEFLKRGTHLYMGKETKETLGLSDNYYLHVVESKKQFQINGNLIVKPFEVPHCNSDLTPCENFGYLVYSKNANEKLLYVTDCHYIPQKFSGLNRIFIECNYKPLESYFGEVGYPYNSTIVEKRRFESHMSVKACIEFLSKQDLSQTKEIRLLHLSSSQYYLKDTIKQEVEESIGKVVKI